MRECLAAVMGLLGIIWHRRYLGHCLIPRLFYSPGRWGRCTVYLLPFSSSGNRTPGSRFYSDLLESARLVV